MFKKPIITIAIFLLLTSQSFAVQIAEVYPNIEKQLNISLKNLNRLHLIGDEIAAVYSNEGEFTYFKSDITGDLYFRVNKGYQSNINLSLETKKGYSYTLLLTTKDIPLEQIILINPEITDKEESNKPDDYKQEIISFFKQIRQNQIPAGYEFKKRSKDYKCQFSKSDHITIKQIAAIIPAKSNIKANAKYKALQYSITNKSQDIIKLSEEQFFQEGILAVSLKDREILPKQETEIIIIK